jgi:hypothetical protein
MKLNILPTTFALLIFTISFFPQALAGPDEKAEAVLTKAVQSLGGDLYLKATSQYGRGKYSVLRENAVISFQTFSDVIVFPDKERTDFKNLGIKTVQVNVGNTGWVFDGDKEIVKNQDENQIANFKRGIRTSIDYLLRSQWRNSATLVYVGKRPASLGRRNDVVRLTYKDDESSVEFEFADDGMPAKALFKRMNADNEEVLEEDRYAQFVDLNGIKAPFIIDHFSKGEHTSRINYESIEFNKSIPESIFARPSSPKEMKKDLKL